MTRRKPNIIAGVLAVLLAAAGFIVWVGYQVVQVPRDAYAVWWTADLVIEHMEKHGGSWPQNWDELRATSDLTYKGTVSPNRDGTMIANPPEFSVIQAIASQHLHDFVVNSQ